MHTINSLRTTLGLSSANQVRNRIEAAKDVLAGHLRRGPNNQILVTDSGLALLRRLQELYDSGLTLTEASEVLRATSSVNSTRAIPVSSVSMSSETKRPQTGPPDETCQALRAEVAFLRQRISYLETERRTDAQNAADERDGWWVDLMGEIDVA